MWGFRYLGLIICLMSLGSNINNYYSLHNQLISMHQDILNTLDTSHKQECHRIAHDSDHSSLKYLNLLSKRVMILKQKQNDGCKVCSRGVELITVRYLGQLFV